MKKILTAGLAATLALTGAAAALAYPGEGAGWDANEPPSRILIIGDSFVMQGGPTAVALAEQRDAPTDAWAISGGAACDFDQASYTARASEFQPTDVAIAFVGNATSQCMQAEVGWYPPAVLTSSQINAIVTVYRRHILRLVEWNKEHGIATYLIASPIMAAGTWHGQVTAAYNSMLAGVASQENTPTQRVKVTNSARNLLAPDGVWTKTIAGLQVRHPSDGTHLWAPYGTTLWALGVLSGPLTGQG
jgi:hypothetical protein